MIINEKSMNPMQAHRRATSDEFAAQQATLRAAGGRRILAYGFGKFRLDLVREQLIGPSGRHVLRRQVFATLRLLLDAAPALVTLDELLDGVWGRHAISPSAVPHVIVELRRALGDPAQASCYIETRHRRGYRVIPTVIRDLAPGSNDGQTPVARPPQHECNGALLDVIDELRALPAQTSVRQRLAFLHQTAAERGLNFLARQALLALQARSDKVSLSAHGDPPSALAIRQRADSA
jgi:DNA-binding winged helix-turn-helix (wHTH) protein